MTRPRDTAEWTVCEYTGREIHSADGLCEVHGGTDCLIVVAWVDRPHPITDEMVERAWRAIERQCVGDPAPTREAVRDALTAALGDSGLVGVSASAPDTDGEREQAQNEYIARRESQGSRLAVDAEGYVWWVHPDGMHTMASTNPDSKPTPMPFTFYRRVPDVPEMPRPRTDGDAIRDALADTDGERKGAMRTEHRIEPAWPTEYWWCAGPKCGEPSASDPCQFCGEPIERYEVMPVAEHEAALAALSHAVGDAGSVGDAHQETLETEWSRNLRRKDEETIHRLDAELCAIRDRLQEEITLGNGKIEMLQERAEKAEAEVERLRPVEAAARVLSEEWTHGVEWLRPLRAALEAKDGEWR